MRERCLFLGMILSAAMMGLAEDNPPCESVWQWQTFPVLGDIPGGTIDDICVGMDINFSPDWGQDSNGVCADNNECENPVTSPLDVTYTWELYLGGQLMDSGEGQTINSTCTVPGYYYLLLEKTGVAVGSQCVWTLQKHFGVNFDVFEVISLNPSGSSGTIELDDQDNDDDTKTFVLCNTSSGTFIVNAEPNVSGITMSSQLPSCWSLTGGSGTSKLFRQIDRSNEGAYTLVATAGTSQKTTKIYVSQLNSIHIKRSNESPSVYALDGGGDIIFYKTFSFKLSTQNSEHDDIVEWALWDLDGTNELLQTGSGVEPNITMYDSGSTKIVFWIDAVRNGNYDSGECYLEKTFVVEVAESNSYSVAQHTTTGMSTLDIFDYFSAGTEALQTRDKLDDIRCAAYLFRNGSTIPTFSETDGFIDSQEEIDEIFSITSSNVKFVTGTSLGWVGKFNGVGNKNIIIVKGSPTKTLLHEVGHDLGLTHNEQNSILGYPENRASHRIMHHSTSGALNTLNQQDYNAYK